ncbi:trypsin-like peptidase domain-containing protein [Gloeothece citriformis]|nr:trypsin-like peptidase domain-containing protein [Gloeothece citriformis]
MSNLLNYINTKIKSHFWRSLLGLVLFLGICLSGLTAFSSPLKAEPLDSVDYPLVEKVPNGPEVQPPNLSSLYTNFVTNALKQAEPAVVQINVSRTLNNLPNVLRPFLGGVRPIPPTAPIIRGVGSGFVIDPKGLILTNAHVVDTADVVSVSFQDGRTFDGEVLGADPITDVAVVKIDARDLAVVPIGNSDLVKQGQWAIAIGNPMGLQETVTVGVISAIDRTASDLGIFDKQIGFLQTDAAINPGNSGGPLLNEKGEVIGINTAIIGQAQGLGFAIPINTASAIAQQLITKGKVDHPYIGIKMIPLTAQIAQQINRSQKDFKINSNEGILIVDVTPRSPAAQAGLQVGDVIQKMNNRPVTETTVVQTIINDNGIEHPLKLEVQRNGQQKTVTVRPEPIPSQVS